MDKHAFSLVIGKQHNKWANAYRMKRRTTNGFRQYVNIMGRSESVGVSQFQYTLRTKRCLLKSVLSAPVRRSLLSRSLGLQFGVTKRLAAVAAAGPRSRWVKPQVYATLNVL